MECVRALPRELQVIGICHEVLPYIDSRDSGRFYVSVEEELFRAIFSRGLWHVSACKLGIHVSSCYVSNEYSSAGEKSIVAKSFRDKK